MTDKDEIAELIKREVAAELERRAKEAPPKSNFVPQTDAEWIDEMHRMRERRMNLASNFHPDDLRAMEAACPTSTAQDLWRHGTVQSPSMGGTSGQVTRVHLGGSPSRTPGYVDPRPLDVPGGARTQELIERQVNAALPHGPEWGKEKK